LEAIEFCVESEPAVVADFSIVLMQAESGPLQWVRGEISFNVLLCYRFVLGILGLCSEAARD
jgi:hypothetical protein